MTFTPQREFSATLVRHGETDWNESRRAQGHNDSSRLTPQGRKQARSLAESFKGQGFERLFASDLDRATETASIMGAVLGLTPETNALLRERSFGSLEGGPVANLTGDVTGIVNDVVVDPDARPPGGESFRDVVVRAGLFIERVKEELPASRLLVVTHGGTVRALRAYWSGATLEGLAWYPVGNCSVWSLDDDAT